MQSKAEIEALREKIELAFESVEKAETTIKQYWVTDNYGMSGDLSREEFDRLCQEAGRVEICDQWQDIPDEEIFAYASLMAHMSARDFRYALPACMRYALNHYDEQSLFANVLRFVVYYLSPSGETDSLFDHSVHHYSLLNHEQKVVIIDFLEFIAAGHHRYQTKEAAKALERYWYKERVSE